MITTTIGTCPGCGMGATIPRGRGFTPGQRVHILTDAEFAELEAGKRIAPDTGAINQNWIDQATGKTTAADKLYREKGIVP